METDGPSAPHPRAALPASVQKQDRGGALEAIQERLSPQVRELMDYAHYADVKEIATEEVVRLT